MAPKKKARLLAELDNPDSSLALLLLRKWAWGHYSANEVQTLAAAALKDQKSLLRSIHVNENFASSSLEALAKIGDSGKYPNSARRDLISALGEPPVPEPCYVSTAITLAKPSPGEAKVQNMPVSVFLPHEMFAFLYSNHLDDFKNKFFGGRPNYLIDFWSELERRRDPRLQGHPMKATPNWKSVMIPISWHGDGVPTLAAGKSTAKSFEVYSFSGLLAIGSSLAAKIYTFGYMANNVEDRANLDPVWKKIMWSFDWAAKGKWPTDDFETGKKFDPRSVEGRRAGSNLANGYCLVLYTFKQDLDHLSREYGLADYRTTNRLCEFCPANKKKGDWGCNFNNFNLDAAWMKKEFTAAAWNAAHPAPHPLFRPAHISCLNIEPDEAHVVHLGVSQYMLGSIFWLLAFACEGVEGASPEAKMDNIWEMIRSEYKSQHSATQMTSLKLKSFCDPLHFAHNYPRLKAKAAETKDLVSPVAAIWGRCMNAAEVDHCRIRDMLKSLVGLQKILHDHSKDALLPLPVAHSFRTFVRDYLYNYSLLANSADREKVLLFSTVVKHHWMWHLGDRALLVNPRRSCCLLDEDYVGRMKEVVCSCAPGTALHHIQSKVADQYRYGFFITVRFGAS